MFISPAGPSGAHAACTVSNRCFFNSLIVDSLLSCWLVTMKLFKLSPFIFCFFLWTHTPNNFGALQCHVIESSQHHFHSLERTETEFPSHTQCRVPMLGCSQVVAEFSGVGPFHHACVVIQKIINKIIVKSAPGHSSIILEVLQCFFHVAVFGFFSF